MEWLLLKWGVSRMKSFDNLVIVLLIVGGSEGMETKM